jgi:putative ABC transport system permease protein
MDFLAPILTFGDNVAVQALLAFPVLLSMVITYRCLQVPDVTIDGSSIFSAAVCVVLVRKSGVDLSLAIPIAVGGGVLAGVITGLLIEVLKINSLLAGILNAFVFYSLSLLLIDAALDFESGTTLFSWLKERDFQLGQRLPAKLVVHPYMLGCLIATTAILKGATDWFLTREWGVAMRGAGSKDIVLQLRGVNTRRVRVIGFGIANGLVGLGAVLMSMYDGSVQVMRWPGTIIFALSVSILGWEAAKQLGRWFKVRLRDTTAVLLGALLYYLIVRVCYTLHITTALPRLVIAVYIIAVLANRSGAWRRIRELLT